MYRQHYYRPVTPQNYPKKHRFKKQAMSGSASPSSESPSVQNNNYLKKCKYNTHVLMKN